MISAELALERLKQGNHRFVTGKQTGDTSQSRKAEMTRDQTPFAIILGCSDSRVPAELIFDQGLGDLFVIRVAGNIAAPSQVGSVEFAAAHVGTRLVVVLGHSKCGAVTAVVQELQGQIEIQSPNLNSIVRRIRPSVEGLLDDEQRQKPEELIARAIRANVTASVNQLRNGSEILEQLIRDDGLLVVGAECSLETGEVEFFEG